MPKLNKRVYFKQDWGPESYLTPDLPSEMTGQFGVVARHFVYSGF